MAQAILVGRAGSPGVGIGRLLPIDQAGPAERSSADPLASDPAGERDRMLAALTAAADELGALAVQTAERAGEEVGAIFEAQALFARDPGIVEPALALVEAGATAADAIIRATDDQAERLAAVDDDYFRERAADVRDVGRRVAALIRGESRPDLWHPDGQPAIVVAQDLDPSAVATLRRELVTGIALAGGAPTGHAAIVARALGIPLVLGLGGAIDAIVGDMAGAVDGSAGRLFIDPSEADLAALAPVVAVPATPKSARSTNGIAVFANVASALEADAAAQAGADGIGLVRTELLFLGRNAAPTVAEQRSTYARIRSAMGDRPVVFRTLDIGGDKPAAWQHATEANPALGVRGLRLGLRNPSLLDDQLTALLEASAGDDLRLMLPMVSTREEIDAARERLEAIRLRLAGEGRPAASSVVLGVMIEVPSAAIMADALAESADFFSIGTNDLVQYTLAADRTNPELADLATVLQPAVLRLIDGVVRAARARGRHVAVCGEAAADPQVVPLLVGLGVTELSVTPASVSSVRELVAGLDLEVWRDLAGKALHASTLAEVRAIAAQDER
jgi:phosphoenolpyruvate-protein phosphotransferase